MLRQLRTNAVTAVTNCGDTDISTNKLLRYVVIKEYTPHNIPLYKNKLLSLFEFIMNLNVSFKSIKYSSVCFLADIFSFLFTFCISANPKDIENEIIVNTNAPTIGMYGFITYKNPASKDVIAFII